MKKLITLALASVAAISVNAADMSVFKDGVLANGLTPQDWWNPAYNFDATAPDGTAHVFSFQTANKADGYAPNGSMGIATNGSDFVTGPLNSATLNFEWYAVGTGTYTVRLLAEGGTEQDYSWTVDDSNAGKWNTIALSVPNNYPAVAEQWKDYTGKGAGVVFSVIIAQGSDDAEIYLNNIYYSDIDESWVAPLLPEIVPPAAVPGIEQANDEVLSVFSSYGNMNFGIGSWNQTTNYAVVTIGGVEAAKLTHFNYIGWEFAEHFSIADYNRMHVDFYPCEETNFGFTPISPNGEKGWIAPTVNLNEWNRYDVDLAYFSNVNLEDIFQIKFDQGNNGAECYLANVYFWKEESSDPGTDPGESGSGNVYSDEVESTCSQIDGGVTKEYPYILSYSIKHNEDKTLTVTADYSWLSGEPFGMVNGVVYVDGKPNDFAMSGTTRTVTTTDTYIENTIIPVKFYIPGGSGCILENEIQYVVGSKHTAATEPKILVEVADIAANSASIIWEIEIPEEGYEGATYEVKLDDTVIESSPYELTGLEPLTTYKYTLSGTVTVNGETSDLAPVDVEFTTLPDGKVASVTANGFTHVMVNPINVDPYFVKVSYAITNNDDGSFTMVFSLPEGTTIPGLVPKISCNDQNADADAATLTATLAGPFAPAEAYEIHVLLAYAGGDTQFNVPYIYATDTAIDEGNVFLFKPGEVNVSEDGESIVVTYETYLSDSMEGAEVSVDWVANEIETQNSVLAEPLSGTASESPFTISGVTPNKNYSISLAARAVLDDTVLSSGSAMSVQADTTTGIASIESADNDAVYYDINGLRVVNPETGIFIKVSEGKTVKVIIKK